jgi:hypothetical protein
MLSSNAPKTTNLLLKNVEIWKIKTRWNSNEESTSTTKQDQMQAKENNHNDKTTIK